MKIHTFHAKRRRSLVYKKRRIRLCYTILFIGKNMILRQIISFTIVITHS